MRTLLVWLLRIVLTFALGTAIFFGVLYVRYTSESKQMHPIVSGFVSALATGTPQKIDTYLYPDPKFVEQMHALQKESHEALARITGVANTKTFPDYVRDYYDEKPPTFSGELLVDVGSSTPVEIGLIKDKGIWKVMQLSIQ